MTDNTDNKQRKIFAQLLHAHGLQKFLLTLMTGLIILFGLYYWIYNARFISTDDAYVNAHVVQITPQVSGQVIQLATENNQYVKQGQLLFTIDQAAFTLAVNKAQAQLTIEQARRQDAKLTAMRTLPLVAKKDLAAQAGDNATSDLQSTAASVLLAKANLAQAELDLAHTQVYAPTNGWVSNLSLRNGDVVTPGQPLFAVVSSQEYWVDANFKETQLQNIRPGQRAEVTVAMYPKHTFEAVVTSISSASGTAFALLPPQNATGNWVKVTQRVPVKIMIVNPDPNYPLRIGTTATVTINSHSSPIRNNS